MANYPLPKTIWGLYFSEMLFTVSMDLWGGVSVANVAQLRLLLCKKPQQNLLGAFYVELFFWKTNATLRFWP